VGAEPRLSAGECLNVTLDATRSGGIKLAKMTDAKIHLDGWLSLFALILEERAASPSAASIPLT
jgi:hypothetical protein